MDQSDEKRQNRKWQWKRPYPGSMREHNHTFGREQPLNKTWKTNEKQQRYFSSAFVAYYANTHALFMLSC